MKIQTIRLTNFRAFPGPAPAEFELGGKNLLVYGENGSGKSSLFHALRGFFSYGQPPDLVQLGNSFSGMGKGSVAVDLSFDDQSQAAWKIGAEALRGYQLPGLEGPMLVTFHPVHSGMGLAKNTSISEAAKFSACLDYRSLLNTNFAHQNRAINLFEIMVDELLSGYVDLATNQTIGQLWSIAKRRVPDRNTARMVKECLEACQRFNEAFKRALEIVLPEAQSILTQLSSGGLELVALPFDNIRYSMGKYAHEKKLLNLNVGLEVSFRGKPLDRPQLYLNEARQSAVALSLYLAARVACAPQTTPHLKLLVLDDVLIGLDHSNRLPVLDVLTTKFAAWQIVLLTHDRGWFDLARERLRDAWACYEIYEGDSAAAAPMPIVRKSQNKPAKAMLAKANTLLQQGYVEAAANYVRQAFEASIRSACEHKNIKLAFKQNARNIQSQDFLNGLKTWPGNATVTKAEWDAAIERLELLKNVVMNPYSHPNAPNIPRQEITQAISAVEAFLVLVSRP